MELMKLQTGTIDVVHENGNMYLQFNANCLDALPFCHGMCCKLQNNLLVQLSDKETKKFGTKKYKENEIGPNNLIQIKPNTTECKYSENDLCSIHNSKPENCKKWHCSPRGNLSDSSIVVRANGWLMLPQGN